MHATGTDGARPLRRGLPRACMRACMRAAASSVKFALQGQETMLPGARWPEDRGIVMEALNALMFQGALLSDSGRLYRLQLPGGDVQVVERWSGSERLSGGFEWWVDVLSTQAGLPLEAWLGRRATLYTRLADGDESPRTGLIHDAYALGSDGGLARYRVGLVPWTWWLSQGRHSRVFQERTLVQIVEAVFADYAPMASWQWSEETSAFLAQARPRSYCVQYRESDLDFVQRLLAEEGLGWRLQEAAPSPGGHQLVVFADSVAQPQG
ncbi:type IV secretion protein Rhs, partial [Xanthomonas oryzae pv. oryzae]